MKESLRIIRFVIVGTMNALIAVVIVWLMMDVCDYDYIPANITAYTVAQSNNFFWSKYWIFPSKTRENSLWQQLLYFWFAFAIAYGAQFIFLVTLVEVGDVSEYWAQFMGLFVYGAMNFVVNKNLTFK